MLKTTRRLISFVLMTLILFPATVLASFVDEGGTEPIEVIEIRNKLVGTPLGETQTEYPIHPYSSGTFPGKIMTVSTTPTRSGNIVYPNLQVQIMGAVVVTAYVELQQYSNGSWNNLWMSCGQGYIDRYFSYNPGREANGSGKYRFIFDINTNGGGFDQYYMIGREFSL